MLILLIHVSHQMLILLLYVLHHIVYVHIGMILFAMYFINIIYFKLCKIMSHVLNVYQHNIIGLYLLTYYIPCLSRPLYVLGVTQEMYRWISRKDSSTSNVHCALSRMLRPPTSNPPANNTDVEAPDNQPVANNTDVEAPDNPPQMTRTHRKRTAH